MNFDLFRLAAEQNQWMLILPEVMLGVLALALLFLEIVLPKRLHEHIPGIAILGQVGVLVSLILGHASYATMYGKESFSGLLLHSGGGQFMRIFFVTSSILVSALGTVALARQRMPKIEFFHIVMVVTAAMMLLAQSNHFVMLFVALETVTVGFYILVSYVRTNPLSLEAGLKYLISGALSSAILLFGIVLLYGVAGSPSLRLATTDPLSFTKLVHFLQANPDNLLVSIAIVMILCGILFKVGAVPFQIWIPDVYQGAPTPVTAFLAVASKGAGIAVLSTLVLTVFKSYQSVVLPLLAVIAGASILFGNLAALSQQNVKRLIGLSGVSHAGYLILGIVAALLAGNEWFVQARFAIAFYLITYLLASFAVFAVMVHVAGPDDAIQELDHYTNLAKDRPFLGLILTIGVGSLAGIPPLAGFIGKLLIFISAYRAGEQWSGVYWLLGVAVVGVMISIYYYFGWIKAAVYPSWQGNGTPEAPARSLATPVRAALGCAMAVLALASVLFGFFQAPVTAWLFTFGWM